MKSKLTLFLGILAFSSFVLQSCENKAKHAGEAKETNVKIIQDEEEVFKDFFEFVAYKDDFEYTSLQAKKGNELHGFVNDKNNDRSLLIGDICEIQWKKDTIYAAGDSETPVINDWLISVKKIKDGNVSKLRKEYKTELKYYWSKEENYSQIFLDKIYLLTEYYIANSKNEILKHHIKTKNQITYSIENQKRENIEYTIMGIGYEFENRSNIFQWLYYNNQNGKLYEYDLPNDKLNEFK